MDKTILNQIRVNIANEIRLRKTADSLGPYLKAQGEWMIANKEILR